MIDGDMNGMNGIACIFWSGFLLVALYRQKVPYSRSGFVERRSSPKLFWILIAANAALVAWTGSAFAFHQA